MQNTLFRIFYMHTQGGIPTYLFVCETLFSRTTDVSETFTPSTSGGSVTQEETFRHRDILLHILNTSDTDFPNESLLWIPSFFFFFSLFTFQCPLFYKLPHFRRWVFPWPWGIETVHCYSAPISIFSLNHRILEFLGVHWVSCGPITKFRQMGHVELPG